MGVFSITTNMDDYLICESLLSTSPRHVMPFLAFYASYIQYTLLILFKHFPCKLFTCRKWKVYKKVWYMNEVLTRFSPTKKSIAE